jgi:hypothetical protein
MDSQETEQIIRCIAEIKIREVSDQVCYSATELSNVMGISSSLCKILTFKINNHGLLTLDIS